MSEKKPQIVFTSKTPYLLVNGTNVRDEKGNPIDVGAVEQLCRCGASKTQPFCDNTHEEDGLDTEKAEDRYKNRWRSYEGESITINFNLGLCCHVGRCLKHLPSVFSKDTKPWINPNGATVEEIMETIRKCPSGALTYTINGETHADFGDEARITIVSDGPIAVRGNIDIFDDNMSSDETVSKTRYTLCRCGKSKNKPFCDGSHRTEDE